MLNHHLAASNKIVFSWPDRDCRSGCRTATFQYPEVMDEGWRDSFIEAFKRQAGKGADLTIHPYSRAMKSIFKFIDNNDSKIFPPLDWEGYMHEHFESCLSTVSQNAKTRLEIWSYSRRIYLELVRMHRIPSSAYIPDNIIRGGCLDEPSAPLAANTERLTVPSHLELIVPKHMLIAKGLELNDDEYLQSIKGKFQLASDAVITGCIKYWEDMKRCHVIGKQLRESISEDEISRVLTTGDHFKNGIHLADPNSPESTAWMLAVAHHYVTRDTKLSPLNYKKLAKTPFFKDLKCHRVTFTRLSKLLQKAAGQMPPGTPETEYFTRLLGFLSLRDCAVACAILMIENPSFTSMSLANADLYTQAGCFYLRARDANSRLVFSVSKPRASQRKLSVLSPLSAAIITDVIEFTATIRLHLKAREKRNWRKLFLFASKLQFGSSRDISQSMIGSKDGVSSVFLAIKHHLITVNIKREGFSLSALRTTQALICFLEHGSLKMVADLLGNTVRTVRKHYIPSWLIVHWASRIIRIMQQKMIVIATEGSPWQLDATDFESEDQLRLFITKMLCSIKHGDAFSQLIHKKLAKFSDSERGFLRPFREVELAIQLDPENIAAIHAYCIVFDIPDKKPSNNIETEEGNKIYVLSNNAIHCLSKLIREAVNAINQDLSHGEAAILNKIAGDSVALFKEVHAEAEQKINHYVDIFSKNKHTFAMVKRT